MEFTLTDVIMIGIGTFALGIIVGVFRMSLEIEIEGEFGKRG